MIELAARLSRMNDDQVDEFQSIIQQSMHKDMTIEETEGKSKTSKKKSVNMKNLLMLFLSKIEEIMVDLYSLGPQLLNSLWQYTEKMNFPSSSTNEKVKNDDDGMNDYNEILDH